MKKEIKRITIKSSSGYCCVEDAYDDKLSITADSITYEYKPYLETEMNPAVKWSYRTNSKNFQTRFSEILKDTDSVLEYIDIVDEKLSGVNISSTGLEEDRSVETLKDEIDTDVLTMLGNLKMFD